MTTTKRNRRNFSASFKTKVVIEALKERYTIEELGKKYELHPNPISQWKKEFLDGAITVFESGKDNKNKNDVLADTEKLYAQIGQLKVENDWLKKKLQ